MISSNLAVLGWLTVWSPIHGPESQQPISTATEDSCWGSYKNQQRCCFPSADRLFCLLLFLRLTISLSLFLSRSLSVSFSLSFFLSLFLCLIRVPLLLLFYPQHPCSQIQAVPLLLILLFLLCLQLFWHCPLSFNNCFCILHTHTNRGTTCMHGRAAVIKNMRSLTVRSEMKRETHSKDAVWLVSFKESSANRTQCFPLCLKLLSEASCKRQPPLQWYTQQQGKHTIKLSIFWLFS